MNIEILASAPLSDNEILLILALIAVIYFLPTLVAIIRKHHNLAPIIVINLFFGWSLIGWVVALVWAVASRKEDQQQVVVVQQPSASPTVIIQQPPAYPSTVIAQQPSYSPPTLNNQSQPVIDVNPSK